jgi:outer membrane protein assembly factor BamA
VVLGLAPYNPALYEQGHVLRRVLKAISPLASLLLLALASVYAMAQQVPVGAEGKRVVAINLQVETEGTVYDRAPASARRHEILGVMRTRLARPFSSGDLARDLRYLTETSHMFRAADWRVELDEELDGVRVHLILTQPLIHRIRYVAPERGVWSEDGVKDLFRFQGRVDSAEGSEFSIPRLDADVKRLYNTGGFLDVRTEYNYTPEGVDVLFRVIQNEPLAMVTFSGIYRTGYTRTLERIIAGLEGVRETPGQDDPTALVSPVYFPRGAFRGDIVTDANPANILGAVEQIKAYYRANGFPFIEVTPRVFSLPPTFDADRIRQDYGQVRDETLSEIERRVRGGYGGRAILVFEVYEGPQVRVGDILFSGIEEVDSPGTDALSARRLGGVFGPILQTWYGLLSPDWSRKARVLGGTMRQKPGAEFVESDALRDAEALQSYLQNRGWLDAQVSLSGYRFNRTRSRVTLEYHVEPGPVYATSDLRIEYRTRAPRVPEGAEPEEFDDPVIEFDELMRALRLAGVQLSDDAAAERYGGAYVASQTDSDRGRHFAAFDLAEPLPWDNHQLWGAPAEGTEGLAGIIRAVLAQRGYSNIDVEFVRVDTESEVLETDWESPFPVRRVGMVLQIQQGYQSIVGNVTFRGNYVTRERVVRRQVSLYPGDVYNRNQLRASDARLRRSQWFEPGAPGQGVISRTTPRLVVENGEFVEYTDVDYDLIEGRTNRLNFSAGFNSATGFMASVDLTLMNFDLSSAVSWMWGQPNWSFTGGGQTLSFTAQPPLDRQQIYRASFNEPWLWGYPVAGGISAEYSTLDYGDYTRTRTSVDPYVGWRVFPDVLWSFGYSYSVLGLTDVSRSAPEEVRRDEGTERLSTLWSEIRWTTTDNPMFPTEGWLLSYRYDYTGGPLLGGTLDFWRMRARAEYYLPIAQIDDIRRLVLAFNVNAYWQDVHSSTDRIPFIERFLLGGNTMGGRGLLRGYEFAGVGPSRRNQAIGGNFMVHGFTELRFPIFPGSLWLVGFVDVGQLAPTLNTADVSGWTVSGGMGLRLLLPILPVPFALDFGFPIIDQPGNREQLISVNLGFGF